MICKHFGSCGGCRLQDIPYDEQLRQKEKRLSWLLEKYEISVPRKPIKFGEQWFYRNKMEFSFGADDRLVCGLYGRKAKRSVLNIEECLIFSEDAGVILQTVRDFAGRAGHSAYDKFNHQGFLRHLIIRETKFTNKLMVGLVTSTSEALDTEAFVTALKSLPLKRELHSLYWIKNDSYSDAIVFEEKALLYGEPLMVEVLGDLQFAVGIDTFFQVNPAMASGFYKDISGYIKPASDEKVIDLFCGVGSIGLYLASQAKFVWGVELSQDITEVARHNAKANNINNISFFAADARKFLNTQGIFYKDIDILVLNPPRCGLSNKILRGIFRLCPKRIFYSSCNPDAFLRDLKVLQQRYRPDFIEPFDFFPHTPHMEVCSLLQKK